MFKKNTNTKNKKENLHRDEESFSLLSQSGMNPLGFKLQTYEKIMGLGYEHTSSFLSTPNLISDLTDISVQILKQDDKMDYLKLKISEMNLKLPATAYLPILNKG